MPSVKIRISQESTEKMEGEVEGLTPSVSRERIAGISFFAHQAINTGKQIVNYEISNVGVKTGNYVLQEQINQAVEIVGDFATIGTGFMAGGWIGGAVAIAGVTTKNVLKEVSRAEGIKHENIEYEYLKTRSGNTTRNGSRGTEN